MLGRDIRGGATMGDSKGAGSGLGIVGYDTYEFVAASGTVAVADIVLMS